MQELWFILTWINKLLKVKKMGIISYLPRNYLILFLSWVVAFFSSIGACLIYESCAQRG